MTIKTSWDVMQQYREALSVAKWRKEVRSKHSKEIRQAGDYLRALRHWIKVASAHKKLRDRKACLTESLNLAHMLEYRASAVNCCERQLVGDSCQNNLRNAMSWAITTLGANTFADWQECCDTVELFIADALVQLDVALSEFKALWKQAKSDMITARIVIDTCAKDILHPVALPKAVRKEMVRVHCAKKVTQVFPKGTDNKTVYSVACEPVNNYHLVSAAACISQREQGTVLSTKAWLRLVRITRSSHAHRNAHNLNNRQDYRARLPVYHNGTIDGRNWFVGSI